jgi:hypothetical protein
LNGSTNFDGQKSTSYKYLYGSFSANRITPAFKFRASYSASQSTDRFSFEQTSIVSTSKNHNLNLLAVKSITDHWSAGTSLNGYSSTYSNIDLAIKVAPAIEYNFFPYSKSTRRQLRILWKPAYNSYRYREEAIYDKTHERVWSNNASITFELKEKWEPFPIHSMPLIISRICKKTGFNSIQNCRLDYIRGSPSIFMAIIREFTIRYPCQRGKQHWKRYYCAARSLQQATAIMARSVSAIPSDQCSAMS